MHLKTLKTLQHISIYIQITFRELVVSSLKSLSLKLLKIQKVHYGNVAVCVVCMYGVLCGDESWTASSLRMI